MGMVHIGQDARLLDELGQELAGQFRTAYLLHKKLLHRHFAAKELVLGFIRDAEPSLAQGPEYLIFPSLKKGSRL